MLRYLFIMSAILTGLIGNAQISDRISRNALKIYNHSMWTAESIDHIRTSGVTIRSTKTFSTVLSPTVAYQWKSSEKTFHEIELTRFRMDRFSERTDWVIDSIGIMDPTPSGQQIKTSEFSLRYEYNIILDNFSSAKLTTSAGLAISPYFNRTEHIPKNSHSFATATTISGASAFLIPRLMYQFSEKFFVDLNIPIYLVDNHLSVSKVENPLFTEDQQRTSTVNSQLLPRKMSCRLGIGINL